MAQKFFVVSDVHGFYDELISALNDAGFDKNNKDHWLVSCGDEWDRGSKPLEVMKFFINLERKILVRGNHMDLFEELCQRAYPEWHDKSNGTVDTVLKIGEYKIDHEFDLCCERALSKTARYRELLVNYFETQNYIFVHGWIPCECYGEGYNPNKPWHQYNKTFKYKPDWRGCNNVEWESARWINGIDRAQDGIIEPNKTIICGHWHCSLGHTYDNKDVVDEFGVGACWEPWYHKGCIAIDRCTAHTGEVNVLVIEDEFDENWLKKYGDKI